MIPLYRADPYLKQCATTIDRVLKTDDGTAVFCREALFMEGGGQPMDFGLLKIADKEFPLLKIIKEKGNTGYVVASDAPCEKGAKVECVLDFDRRYSIMKLHTAQHLLAGSLRVIRSSLLTGGMSISANAKECHVLYPQSSELTDACLVEGLKNAHHFIEKDCLVSEISVSSEAEAVEKFQDLYRPTVASGTLKGNIRLVVIDGVDANACGGTHVKSLQEIGGIQILDVAQILEGQLVKFSVD